MNETEEIDTLLTSLKNEIEENNGELGYWGEKIDLSSLETKPKADSKRVGFGPADKKTLLNDLFEKEIGDCQICPLGKTRIKLVFGVGNPNADIMFIGEGPGFDEDRKGEPFVGKAGQLLDKILSSIQLDRTKVYIANVVKCHPMKNSNQPDMRGNDRPPSFDEMNACLPYLKKQIAIIQPKIVVTLGATAAKGVLGSMEGITKIRGQVRQVRLIDGQPPIPVLPTFHPAALLRDPDLKRPVWEDMKLLKKLAL